MRNPTVMTLGNMRANGVGTLAVWCLVAVAVIFGF